MGRSGAGKSTLANLALRFLSEVYQSTSGCTTLVITHRLVHMERMDDILVLDHGRIVERGTHQELLKRDGLYKRMLDVQNQMLETV